MVGSGVTGTVDTQGNAVTVTGAMAGPAGSVLNAIGAGSLTLNNSNSGNFLGTLKVNPGATVAGGLGTAGSVFGAGSVQLAGGTLQVPASLGQGLTAQFVNNTSGTSWNGLNYCPWMTHTGSLSTGSLGVFNSDFNAGYAAGTATWAANTAAFPGARSRIWYPDGQGHFQPLGWDGLAIHNLSTPAVAYDPNNIEYAMRMTGYIDITNAGTYNFATNSDNGSEVWVDGQEVVWNNVGQGMADQNNPSPAQGTRWSIALSAGIHQITVGYYEGTGGHGLNLSYQGPDTVPAYDDGGPLATYVDGNVGGWVFIPNSVLYNAGGSGSSGLAVNLTSNLVVTAESTLAIPAQAPTPSSRA